MGGGPIFTSNNSSSTSSSFKPEPTKTQYKPKKLDNQKNRLWNNSSNNSNSSFETKTYNDMFKNYM